jgi:hypothetical protein
MRVDVANVAMESKIEQTVKTKDYTTSFTVDQSPDEVFDSIANVRGGGQKELTVVLTNSVLSLSTTIKTFIEAKDAYDRAIGLAEGSAMKEFLAQDAAISFSWLCRNHATLPVTNIEAVKLQALPPEVAFIGFRTEQPTATSRATYEKSKELK